MKIKLAYLNLFRNKRRSFSTGLAICIGFIGLNLLGAYIYRVKKALDNTSIYSALHGHVQIFKKDSLVYFSLKPKKYIIQKEEIIQIEEILKTYSNQIEYIGKNLNGSGLLSNGVKSHPILFFSFEPEVYARSILQPELSKWARDWVLPSQLENAETFKNNQEIMSVTPKIAEIMALKNPLKLNEALQLAARSFDGDLNAINLELGAEHTTGMQFLEDTLVLIPFTKAQELLATEGAESLSIYLNNNEDFKDFKRRIDQDFQKLPFELESFFYFDEKINAMYLGTLGFLIVMGAFFVFLIGSAVSLTIINSLTMGIIERTREMGTLLAVGFKRKDIRDIFILENIFLCLSAIAVGIVLSLFISWIINSLNFQFTPPAVTGKIQFRLVWNLTIGLSVGVFIFVLTYLSSVFVMHRKLKTKLIDLLNDSGA